MTYDKLEKLVTYIETIETYTGAIYREEILESGSRTDRIEEYEKKVKRAKQATLDLFQAK